MLNKNIAVVFKNFEKTYSIYFYSRLKQHLITPRINFFKNQICAAHTDIKVPDFTKYRRDSVKRPDVPSDCSEDSRKIFSYMVSGTVATVALYGLKSEVTRWVH